MARIIVIDDSPAIRDMVSTALRIAGHSVDTAADGRSGMALHRSAPADVVITDIFMPDVDGVETIQAFRQEFPAVKIIAMSGAATTGGGVDYLSTARSIGANSSLLKPFDISALLTAVREVTTN